MPKQGLTIRLLDSYPELRGKARARYCAMVSRDPQNPRSRQPLHGRGVQFLELRSEVCGTITTVQKDTLLWLRRGDTIKF